MMKCVVNKLERLTKEKERRDGERERRWRKRGEMEKEEKVRKGRHFIYLV